MQNHGYKLPQAHPKCAAADLSQDEGRDFMTKATGHFRASDHNVHIWASEPETHIQGKFCLSLAVHPQVTWNDDSVFFICWPWGAQYIFALVFPWQIPL
jgi:hypothetical protein